MVNEPTAVRPPLDEEIRWTVRVVLYFGGQFKDQGARHLPDCLDGVSRSIATNGCTVHDPAEMVATD